MTTTRPQPHDEVNQSKTERAVDMVTKSTQGDGIHWAVPRPGQLLRFEHDRDTPVTGVMDVGTEDSSVIWINMSDGQGRRLLHCDDGYRLVRIETSPG